MIASAIFSLQNKNAGAVKAPAGRAAEPPLAQHQSLYLAVSVAHCDPSDTNNELDKRKAVLLRHRLLCTLTAAVTVGGLIKL
jgi:hypothetical protein